jgi:hypothetical protein
MKINQIYKIILLLLFITLLSINLEAKGDKNSNDNSLKKTLGSPNSTRFNINKIGTYIYANGWADIVGSNPGYYYPILGGHTANFQSGFLWGGYVGNPADKQLRVGGSVYRTSLTPGRILSDGTAESEDAPNARVFRVRKDYKTGSLSVEAQDEGRTEEAVYKQYETDWNEWPADEGAPFDDIDGNGKYNPAIDIPGVPGADQTIWFVANDLSTTAAQSFYGTTPMGVEIQCTVWGYKQSGALGQMLFKKYLMINKNAEKKDFNQFYVSYWSDTDIGGGSSDYSACDTTRSLFYTYSAITNNVQYAGNPPATGYDFFQGPRIYTGNQNDTAIFKGQYVTGYKNMGLTTHYFFINGSTVYTDPDQNSADGTKQWYNLFQGKVSTSGNDFIDPTTNLPCKFTLYGDPVAKTGWLDAEPGDRRNGGVSGPFTLAYGDTQEVVIAQMSAGASSGIDNIGAVQQLKSIDDIAQVAYNRLFKLPTPAPIQVVKITPMDKKLVLNWGWDQEFAKETENYNYELKTPGLTTYYNFQGYNVYQLPTRSASVSEGIKLKTFDIIDNVTAITDLQPDKSSGILLPVVIENGINSGLSRYLIDTVDAFTKLPFVNGTEYYFAVTSYSYNPNPQFGSTALENPLVVVTAIPQAPQPGYVVSGNTDEELDVSHTGTADASISVKVVDPTKLTGHDYEVFFNQKHYYLDSEGKWQTTNYPDSIGKKLGKVNDVTGSTLSGVAVYTKPAGNLDINFILDLQSPTQAFADGIKLTFPPSIKIINAPAFDAVNGSISPVVSGNVIDFGLVTHDSTQNGAFGGGEVIKVTVSNYTLPIHIDYTIYDDGYGNDSTTALTDAKGTVIIDKIGNKFVTQNHWNVRDLTTNEVKLADQTVIGQEDLYYTDPAEGPGGSLGYIGSNVGANSQPVIDGLQVIFNDGSYLAPINYTSAKINVNKANKETSGKTFSDHAAAATAGTSISNYTAFSGVITSKATDNYGVGTDDIDQLQQDYQMRFTGVLDTTVINGKNVVIVKSGGQMATVFKSQFPLSDRPDNTGGANAPYLTRIPFEVWNVSDPNHPRQVNLTFRDREQTATSDPFQSWPSSTRVYAVVVNSDYNPNKPIQISGGPDADNALATWVWVFWSSHYTVGDTVNVKYANPLQLSKDTFKFTAPNATAYQADVAKADVEKINVFPNPYYGVNPREVNKYSRFVTFSHLPAKATIRIFNLAGQLVRTIEKDPVGGQFVQWNLLTDNNFPVASGLYIVHIDMPELGKTKILKVAIIQEQQILDHF